MAKNFEVKINDDKWKLIASQMQFLQDTPIYVGVAEDTMDRRLVIDGKAQKQKVSNADLLFIHTNGSPVNNIPPRPVVEPAIEDSKDTLAAGMKKAADFVLSGSTAQAEQQLKATGLMAQNFVRAWFDSDKNGWAPNAPSVAARKIAKGSIDPKPLIDTGELRKSITYFVESKGVRKR